MKRFQRFQRFHSAIFFSLTLACLTSSIYAQTGTIETALEVWANEAMVAINTYNNQDFVARQKEIAQYFTASAWIQYSRAFQASKIPQAIQENHYTVSSVALLPPVITQLSNQHWQAVMPLLVLYKNPQYQQKQTLNVTLQFMRAPSGQGMRGFVVTLFQSKIASPPCQCDADNTKNI